MSSGRIIKNTFVNLNGNLEAGNYPTISTTDNLQTNLEETYPSKIKSLGIKDPIESSINLQLSNELNKIYIEVFKVHLILLNNSNLTNSQKLEYCRIERYFIKLFLKEVVKKYQ